MSTRQTPRLRTIEKVKPPYPLNKFPSDFGFKLGKELIYLLSTKTTSELQGPEWEEIFANCISANWKPSNIGLDDIELGNCVWSAKSVKQKYPSKVKTIRLISGRNSTVYSYGDKEAGNVNPSELGEKVLEIWNERVSAIREKYKHARTIVIIKSKSLEEVVVFEFETLRYEQSKFYWKWNKAGNLEGYDKNNDKHRFTWQWHGSQFTIKHDVPEDSLVIRIKKPEKFSKDKILKNIGFKKDWIEVSKKND